MGASISAMGVALSESGYTLELSPECFAIMAIVMTFSIAWGMWLMISK